MSRKTGSAVACWLSLLPCLSAAAERTTALRLEAYAGQFFFGRGGSLATASDWLAGSGLELSGRDTLIGAVSGRYRRTREVRELVTGGTETAEVLDNSAFLRWVRRLNESWTIKPNLSYKNELITSAGGDSLGAGLFDYHKLSFAVEAERRGEACRSLRQGVSSYATRFYHYRAEGSPVFNAELRSGDEVLDFNAYDFFIAAECGRADIAALSTSWHGSYREFTSQRIIDAAGGLEGRERRDLFGAWTVGLRRELPPLAAALDAAYARLDSNQNNFDPVRARFNPGYYDYGEYSLRPTLSWEGPKGLSASLSYEYSRREYPRRPRQNPDGSYAEGAVHSDTQTLSCSFSYSLRRNLTLKGLGARRLASSNTRFEGAYRYNYAYAYYFMGLGLAL